MEIRLLKIYSGDFYFCGDVFLKIYPLKIKV